MLFAQRDCGPIGRTHANEYGVDGTCMCIHVHNVGIHYTCIYQGSKLAVATSPMATNILL